LGIATRALPETPPFVLTAIDRIASSLVEDWEKVPTLAADFGSRYFTTALLAAAALPESTNAAVFRSICQREWDALDQSGRIGMHPTLLWTGRNLARRLSRGEGTTTAAPWYPSQITKATSPYTLSAASTRQLVADVAALTDFGTVPPPLPAEERQYLATVLPFLTFFHLKQGDLDLLAPLSRALRYLHMTEVPEFELALGFIVRSSRIDGHLGANEIVAEWSKRESGNESLAAEIALPITVACVWALSDTLWTECV